MEFLKVLRLDVIAIIVFILIIVANTLRNQRKVWRNLISFILAICLVGIPLYLDAGGLFSSAAKWLNINLWPTLIEKTHATGSPEIYSVLGFIVVLIILFLIYLVIKGIICLLFDGDAKRYRKYPSYCTVHKPISGLFGGIIKGFIVVYIMFIAWSLITAYTGISTSNDILFNLFTKFDGIVKKIISIFQTGVGIGG